MNTKVLLLMFLVFVNEKINAQRLMEYLDRGVAAVHNAEGKVFVSWRLLGTEPGNTSFNLYRSIGNGKLEKLNKQPITRTTNFLDENNDSIQQRTYVVKTILRVEETETSKRFILKPGNVPYFSIS